MTDRPWEPRGLAPLHVGDHVRACPSGECRFFSRGHSARHVGAIGVVGGIEAIDATDTHPYAVHFGDSMPPGWRFDWFARAELERLS